jgi:hypothetical protein
MNEINLKGIIKDIQPSHSIDDISFYKAKLLCKRPNGAEDVINLRFKEFSNKYKDNDEICLSGNIRSYSYKTSEDKNKVVIYVFTYFDIPEEMPDTNNFATLDGRICKINDLRTTKNGKHNIHFILANNLISSNNSKRLNSYIPCIAWGSTAKKLSELDINTRLKVIGELHSREHKKIHEDGNIEIRVAHEFLVTGYEVIE